MQGECMAGASRQVGRTVMRHQAMEDDHAACVNLYRNGLIKCRPWGVVQHGESARTLVPIHLVDFS